jgi:YidC/Oxa1 family membrane protein insertase
LISVNKRLRTLLLLAVLLAAVLILSGCSVPQGDIDLNNPPTAWEQYIVYPLAKLLIVLNDFLAGIGVRYSWGWAIIVFTIGIKLVTLPLTAKQLKSTKAQQDLQPKLRELQEKYGKDKQKLSEEQMKLYKEAGINPLGGCLPLLIQLPILWGLYQALYVLANPSVGKLNGAPFYWIPDLSFPSLTVGTKWISASFNAQEWDVLFAYFSLPVFMLITQLLLQKMSQPRKDPKGGRADAQTQMMGQMMYLMPVMFFWITLGLPSGLTLYWSVSNLLSIVQQYFVTGWGSLADWFPFLRKGQPAPVGVTTSAAMTTTAQPTPAEPEKPIKRRKRRK